MAEPLEVRCAQQSLALGEPLPGTASRVRRWLLVEQPGAWGPDALADSALAGEAADRLGAAGRRHGVRVVLIRRPRRAPGASGDVDRTDVRRVVFAHTSAEGSWMEHVELPTGDLVDVIERDLAALDQEDPPGLGEPGPSALHLVCVNGRHDPCCADLGRPVVRALVAAGAPEVWESSHVGGDRFAANVVCLPEGVYYGRVQPEWAPELISDHGRGLIDLEHYRGRSCYRPEVQVAEAATRELLGERRLDAVSVLEAASEAGLTTVDLAVEGTLTATVTVERMRAEAQQLTCHAAEPGGPWRYVLRDVRRR
jgi:hypothetical protein